MFSIRNISTGWKMFWSNKALLVTSETTSTFNKYMPVNRCWFYKGTLHLKEKKVASQHPIHLILQFFDTSYGMCKMTRRFPDLPISSRPRGRSRRPKLVRRDQKKRIKHSYPWRFEFWKSVQKYGCYSYRALRWVIIAFLHGMDSKSVISHIP